MLITVWQPNAAGHHAGGAETVEAGFRSSDRVVPNLERGQWAFDAVKPGLARWAAPGAASLALACRAGDQVGLYTLL